MNKKNKFLQNKKKSNKLKMFSLNFSFKNEENKKIKPYTNIKVESINKNYYLFLLLLMM